MDNKKQVRPKKRSVKCPNCDGKGLIIARDDKGRKIGYDTCPVCGGAGYTWEEK